MLFANLNGLRSL